MLVVQIPRMKQQTSPLPSHVTPVKVSTIAEAVQIRMAKQEREERKKAERIQREEWERAMAEANGTPRRDPVSCFPHSSKKDPSADKLKQAVGYEAPRKRKKHVIDGEESEKKRMKR